ncbi:spore coat protein [Bacillus vallismortis]|uniref:spore coat protein n=1 Tax=Bacillus vallismortis TaxID=72361 RepID=UPI0020903DFC|nr:spore coat protein [Bacillus vallismortis]MCO4851520.1 spore coat protein [Bacillus vallismortis]
MDQLNQQQSQMNKGIPGKPHKNHGGHEMFDMHEVLSGTLNVLDQFTMLKQLCKDQELVNILDRQHQFIASQYNVTAECFKTGNEPSQKTATYMMKEDNQTVYGMQPSMPKKPVQSMNDIDDSIISRQMLCTVKAQASMLTMASLEMTNPAVRRVLSAQIQQYVEMAFEIFLYQNKHGYYQVPQLDAQDMEQMKNSFAPAQGQMPPTQGGMGQQGLH